MTTAATAKTHQLMASVIEQGKCMERKRIPDEGEMGVSLTNINVLYKG